MSYIMTLYTHYLHTYVASNMDALTPSLTSNLAPLIIRNSTISSRSWDTAMCKAVWPLYTITYTLTVNG